MYALRSKNLLGRERHSKQSSIQVLLWTVRQAAGTAVWLFPGLQPGVGTKGTAGQKHSQAELPRHGCLCASELCLGLGKSHSMLVSPVQHVYSYLLI